MKTLRKDIEPLKQAIIAIDCGVNGAICLYTNKTILVEKMPNTKNYDNYERIKMILHKFREIAFKEFDGLYPICFIEHVEGRGSDSGYTIAKLTFNYGLCCAYADGLGMNPITFYAISWKAYMKLLLRNKKGQPKVTEAMKKGKTIEFINKLYPWLEFTKPLCDAIAIGEFGRRILAGEIILKKNHIEQQKMIAFRVGKRKR